MMFDHVKLVFVGALFAIAPIAHAAIIVSADFSTVTPGTYTSGQAIGPAFTVTSGSVDIVGTGFFGELCTTGQTAPCVDLNGLATGSIGTASLVLAPGNYVLSFVLNGSQRGVDASTTVSLGALFSQTFITPSATVNNVVNQNISVASGTTAILSFTSNTSGNVGSILDNVSLNSVAGTGVPEPSTLLLCLGALPLAWKLRRRS